jgi:hypothetical protein
VHVICQAWPATPHMRTIPAVRRNALPTLVISRPRCWPQAILRPVFRSAGDAAAISRPNRKSQARPLQLGQPAGGLGYTCLHSLRLEIGEGVQVG